MQVPIALSPLCYQCLHNMYWNAIRLLIIHDIAYASTALGWQLYSTCVFNCMGIHAHICSLNLAAALKTYCILLVMHTTHMFDNSDTEGHLR